MKSTQFIPAADRLLLKRLPPPPEGAIVKPQIAVEQSEYGWVIAVGTGVDVPLGPVAKFSRFSAEEIAFDDSGPEVEFVLSYRHDIRGWFEPEPKPGWLEIAWQWLQAWFERATTPVQMAPIPEPECRAMADEPAVAHRGPVALGEAGRYRGATRLGDIKRPAETTKFDA